MGMETTTHGGVAATDVSVVVCFAFADLPSIRALEPGLHGPRVHVHLVPGIDRDLEGAGMYLLQEEERTVFAVAHSPALDSARLDQLVALFGKQRARMHRLCVVEYDDAHPEDFIRAIGAAVQNMRARSDGGPGSSLSAGRSQPSTVRSTKRARASLSLRAAPLAPSVATAESASTEAVVEAAESVTMGETSTAARTEEVLLSDSMRDAMIRTSPGAGESGDTFPDLGDSARKVMEGRAARARADAKRRRRWIATAVVATAVAVGAVVAYRVGVRPSEPEPGREGVQASLSPDRGVETTKGQRARPDAALTQERKAPPEDERPSKVVSPTVSVIDAEEADAARRVRAALDSGRIHALDALLVRRPGRHDDAYADAARRCRRVQEAGLEAWRLPTLDELRELRRARMLPEGVFWSSSRRSGEAFTLSRGVTRPEPTSIDAAADTLCVRSR